MNCKLRITSVLLTLVLVVTSVGIAHARTFTDTGTHWARNCISWATNKSIIVGYKDGTFKPDIAISRAEYLAIVNRNSEAANITANASDLSFSDVASGDWFANEVAKSVKAGYIKDDGGSLNPNEKITRAEAMVIFSKAKKFEQDAYAALKFTDAGSMNDLELAAVGAAAKQGIINGYPDGNFGPRRTLTRAEVVTVLFNYARVSGEDMGPEPEPAPEPGPSPASALLPDNVWSFINSRNHFGQGYQLNDELWNAIRNNFDPTDLEAIEKGSEEKWGGSCFGFTTTIALMNKGELSFAGLNDGSPSTLSQVQAEDSYRTQSLINYYQLMQSVKAYRKNFGALAESGKNVWVSSGDKPASDFAEEVKAAVDAYKAGGHFVCFNIHFFDGGGHAQIALDYEENGDQLTVWVYDPNETHEDGKCKNSALIDKSRNKITTVAATNAGEAPELEDLAAVSMFTDPNIYNIVNPQKQSPANSSTNEAYLTNYADKPFSFSMNGRSYQANPDTQDLKVLRMLDAPTVYVLPGQSGQIEITGGGRMDYSIQYGDKFLAAETDSGRSVAFDQSGAVQVNAPGSGFKASVTVNNKLGGFGNNKIEVSGRDGSNVSIANDGTGYKVTGSNLAGVQVVAKDPGSATAKIMSIDTDHPEVFIRTEGSDVVAQIDTTGDGQPDTEVGRGAEVGTGDGGVG